MGARKAETYPIHLLSLDAITVDHELQSRVKMSIEDMREYAEFMLRGDVFPPVVVFFDGDKHWLADGFHRHGTQVNLSRTHAKYRAIRAEVRKGTRDEAVVFSAGANQKYSIGRSDEDIQKAVWMLLDFPEWRAKSIPAISGHVGTTVAKARKAIHLYHAHHEIPLPDERENKSGQMAKVRNPTKSYPEGHVYLCSIGKGRKKSYFGKLNGKQTYLCPGHKGIAYARSVLAGKSDKSAEIVAASESDESPVRLIRLEGNHTARIRNYLVNRLIACKPANEQRGGGLPGLFGLGGDGWILTWAALDKNESAVLAIGRILCLHQMTVSRGEPAASRKVILCVSSDGPGQVLDIGRQLGIEFLTPEEFVASLKGTAGEGGQ